MRKLTRMAPRQAREVKGFNMRNLIGWLETRLAPGDLRRHWLRTNGVNTNGAAAKAAKVINFDRLGKTGTPRHFWEYKSGLTGVPKRPLCQET